MMMIHINASYLLAWCEEIVSAGSARVRVRGDDFVGAKEELEERLITMSETGLMGLEFRLEITQVDAFDEEGLFAMIIAGEGDFITMNPVSMRLLM